MLNDSNRVILVQIEIFLDLLVGRKVPISEITEFL